MTDIASLQYKGGMFKFPTPERWIVVVTGSKLIDELLKFPDDQVSFLEAAGEVNYIILERKRVNLTFDTVYRSSEPSTYSAMRCMKIRIMSVSFAISSLATLLVHLPIFKTR